MRNVIFKKSLNLEKGTKSFSVEQMCEDQECTTHVHKSFNYRVTHAPLGEARVLEPQIYIKKKIDTKKQIELFSLHVKGSFYITHQRQLFDVHFEHTLDIQINWKSKVFSPKKSVVLTKQ